MESGWFGGSLSCQWIHSEQSTKKSMAMWRTIQDQVTLVSLMPMMMLTSLVKCRPCHSKMEECCKFNSMHTTNARFLSRLSSIASMQPISRDAWDILDRAVVAPAGLEDVLLQLQIEWANIPQRKITTLMRSMNSRVHTCIAAQGGPTHYETDRILAWPHMGSVSHGGCITHSMKTIITWNVCWGIKLCYRPVCYMFILL